MNGTIPGKTKMFSSIRSKVIILLLAFSFGPMLVFRLVLYPQVLRGFQELTSYLQLVRDNYGYKEISLVDNQGKIRVSAREDFLGLGIEEFDYFREALKGNIFVTRVHPSVFSIPNEFGEMERGVPTLFVSGPIRDDRYKVIGVVSLRVDVAAISKEMRRVKLGETGETYLAD